MSKKKASQLTHEQFKTAAGWSFLASGSIFAAATIPPKNGFAILTAICWVLAPAAMVILNMRRFRNAHSFRAHAVIGSIGAAGLAGEAIFAKNPLDKAQLIGSVAIIATNIYQNWCPNGFISKWTGKDFSSSANKIAKITYPLIRTIDKPLAGSAWGKFLITSPGLLTSAYLHHDILRIAAFAFLSLGYLAQTFSTQPDVQRKNVTKNPIL